MYYIQYLQLIRMYNDMNQDGAAGSENATGDSQKKLDVIIFKVFRI